MLECKECEIDESNDLEYCGEHIIEIKCPKCEEDYQVFFESDYNEMMEGEMDSICISCLITERIDEIEKNDLELKKLPKIKYTRAEALEFFQIWFGEETENVQS